MIRAKTDLVLFVTVFAVVFTSLTYIFPSRYVQLWLSLEIIIIPTLYLIGYELLLEKQKKMFEEKINLIEQRSKDLEHKNTELKLKLKEKSS